MDLLERYLQAVGRFLPEARRADILAELGANLREQMDDRAEALGRPLTMDDQAAILQRHGQPIAVAARYSNAPPLIGPEIAPFYWFTLRRVTPIVLAVVTLTRAAIWIYIPGTPRSIGPQIGAVWSALLLWLAQATLLFAVIDWYRRHHPEAFVSRWDPRKLPALRADPSVDRPRHPLIELFFSVLWLLWLLAFPHFPVLLFGPSILGMHALSQNLAHTLSLDLAPVWRTFYWFVVGLTGLQILFKLITLAPVSSVARRGMKLTEQLISLTMLIFLLRSPVYLVPGPNASPGEIKNLALWNGSIHQSFTLIAAIVAGKLLWDIVQLLSRSTRRPSCHTAPL